MKKLLWSAGAIVVLFVVFLGVKYLGVWKSNNEAHSGSGSGADASGHISDLPQIELVKPSLYLVADDGSKKELRDNDFLTPPATVQTSASGEAVVHFADGSMARIDSGTTFTLKEANYDGESGKSNVTMGLSIGKIWSKVVELATPDSSWNVETSNAVATVRGTAFGVEASTTVVRFFGSEHEVTVTPINPLTREQLDERSAPLLEDQYIELRNALMQDLVASTRPVPVRVATVAIRADSWIAGNEQQDARVNEVIQNLEDKNLSPIELRQELHEHIREELRAQIEEGDVPTSTPQEFLDSLKNRANTTTTPLRTTPKPTPTTPLATSTDPQAKPVSIDVVANVALTSSIDEGKTIQFKATAKFSDGTVRDVTPKVSWKVLGPIGSITSVGVFTAQLDASVSESGEGSGAVIATFTGPAGETFLGKSPIFKVVLVFDNANSTTDGQ